MVAIASFFFLSQTEIYYQYCKNAIETGDFLVDESLDLYKKICNDHYKDYSDHYLMNHTINIFYNFMEMTSTKLLSLNSKKYMKKRISESLSSLEFNLKLHKFTHTSLYIVFIYLGIVSVPNVVFSLFIFIINKILILTFFAFTAEAMLNYLFNINLDLVQISRHCSNYINLDIIMNTYSFLSRFVGFSSNHTEVL